MESSLFFASADAVLCALGRGSKGSAAAARWSCSKPVPEALMDAVDGTPGTAATIAAVTTATVDSENACPDCADGDIIEGLAALLAEDEEAALAMHGHGDVL